MAPLLDIHAVGVSFGGVRALDGVSFSTEAGRIFSIIGPNGAGKTTLFNVISGAYPAQQGKVVIAGRDMTTAPPSARAALGLQRTFQNLQIFGTMTALENVMVGGHLRQRTGFPSALLGLPSVAAESRAMRRRATELLDLFDLAGLGGAVAGELAYGQQKRLEIARALACEPRILLLDEPAAGLNPSETEDLANVIRRLAGMGIAVVLVEHDMRLVMAISDELLVLNFGRELARGTPAEVSSNPAVIEAYLGVEVD
ncbi:ABC transporter ATP-binding protein [Xanthobacter tagetidis]|jgi:branched-chain amino acid transport system ATP-binding protein|uniref:ABC transporter ATP-binding protein n=1 Tax=Xanthobacter tagetidis TaxID=60216 RepID=A0A3L7ALG9_9HYPH|nr:ABC transporter ATP-binding protein [Xanthobacter tagetidis]MBB6309104.1 branched-chain amino acid transport system ATP-binding protein [Xanthobacter tagetidis]RLP80408.1 ABC transporter ATP-binding protein [Xanthobacter tagetidis]